MHILLLNQTFYPDVAATAQYASDLAAMLVEQGNQVTVISSRRCYVDPRVVHPWSETWRGVRILRCPASGFGKDAKWRRALDFATFLVTCAGRASVLSKFDVVISLTTPPLLSALAAVIARMNGARFIYWVMDLNPDQAIAAGWLRSNSRVTRVLNGVLRFSLRNSDEIVVLDRFMATRLAGKGVPAARLSVIPLWPQDDAVKFDSAAAEEFRRRHQLTGKFVVMYSGNHSPCHPLDTLVDAAKLLSHLPNIMFCFVGGGSEFARLQTLAASDPVENIRCIPYQPLGGLSASLSSADLHAVVMGDPYVGIVHPSKVYNIQRIGAPFVYIGPARSPVAELSPTRSFRHGAARELAQFIESYARQNTPGQTGPTQSCSRQDLLGRLISAIEGKPGPRIEYPRHS